MSYILQLLFSIAFLFCVWFALGSLVYLRSDRDGFGERILAGFVAYYALFEIPAFVFMILEIRLWSLTIVWFSLLAVLVLCSVLVNASSWKSLAAKLWKALPVRNLTWWSMLAIVTYQCGLVALAPDDSFDSAFYVANVTTNIATNSINCFHPFTGLWEETFNVRYLFGLYPTANACFCQLTGIHPLVYTKTVLFVVTVLLAYLVLYLIGRELFGKDTKKTSLFVIFASLINLFFDTMYSNASFLLARGYEGKAIIANVFLPLLFLIGFKLWNKQTDRQCWTLLAMIGISAMDISMSAMVIIPGTVSVVLLPYLWNCREKKLWIRWILILLPSVVLFLAYLLVSRGYLNFLIVRG